MVEEMNDNRPICPYCNTRMVRTHIELEDSWLICWLCECKEFKPVSQTAWQHDPGATDATLQGGYYTK